MSDRYVPPPPPYELSLQRDQKISEELQLLELSTKPPIQDEDDGGWKESKDSKTLAQKAFVEASIQPLRIQKRSGAGNGSSLRGPRPLPPSPADSRTRNAQWPQSGRRSSPIQGCKAKLPVEDSISAPPPFTSLGASRDGPPHEQTFSHRNPSNAPSPLSNPPQPSLDGPRRHDWYNNQGQPSFRRVSHGAFHGNSSPAISQGKSHGMRLAFNPSVAYVNPNTDQWGALEAQTVGAASLYSSAVSSHLHPSSAVYAESRHPHIGFTTNKRSTYARPSTSNTETYLSDTPPSPRSLQSHTSLPIGSSAPSPSLPYSPRAQVGNGYQHFRWATSESEITRDLYRG